MSDPKKPTIAYCPRCKVKRTVVKPRRVLSKNGRTWFHRGSCPECEAMLFRAIGKDDL